MSTFTLLALGHSISLQQQCGGESLSTSFRRQQSLVQRRDVAQHLARAELVDNLQTGLAHLSSGEFWIRQQLQQRGGEGLGGGYRVE